MDHCVGEPLQIGRQTRVAALAAVGNLKFSRAEIFDVVAPEFELRFAAIGLRPDEPASVARKFDVGFDHGLRRVHFDDVFAFANF